ncbi:MAG: DegT/DnrJ/EryC1/StrS family aminotransferase, partial [Caulobacterales bacterium]
GLTPYLADVDEATGALTPAIARRAMERAPRLISAVVPVLPFGHAGGVADWTQFEKDTGVPVVVDGAAAFDAVRDATTPIVVSMHATKALGIGEGGFLATTDQALADHVRALTVFGFTGTRDSQMPAFNAKLSEYAGAVGLAALDFWPETPGRLIRASHLLRASFLRMPEVEFQHGWGADWTSTTCIVNVPDGQADIVERRLAAGGIETRRWWERGLHRQPAFRNSLYADDLSATNKLAARVIGLPFSVDLTFDDAAVITQSMAEALGH